jgi:hypothetical protein
MHRAKAFQKYCDVLYHNKTIVGRSAKRRESNEIGRFRAKRALNLVHND